MSISTTIGSSTWNVNTKQVLYEFFTDSTCFGVADDGNMQVLPYVTTTQESLEIAKLEYQIVNISNKSTGIGANGANAVFQYVTFEITIKDSEKERAPGRLVELELDRKADTLQTCFRSSKGRPLLGNAGFRNAKLEGPIPVKSKYYYGRRFLLSGKIEVG